MCSFHDKLLATVTTSSTPNHVSDGWYIAAPWKHGDGNGFGRLDILNSTCFPWIEKADLYRGQSARGNRVVFLSVVKILIPTTRLRVTDRHWWFGKISTLTQFHHSYLQSITSKHIDLSLIRHHPPSCGATIWEAAHRLDAEFITRVIFKSDKETSSVFILISTHEIYIKFKDAELISDRMEKKPFK